MDKRLAELVARIPKIASDHNEVNPEQVALVKAIQQYGGTAIPLLLPYLEHPRYGVRRLTAWILQWIHGWNDSHLNALIHYQRANESSLLSAIAKIGTPRAIAFLTEELQRSKNEDLPIGSAFKILSIKGIPALCRLLQVSTAEDSKLSYAIVKILQRSDYGAKKAALDPLLHIVMNKRIPTINRQNALLALGGLGEIASPCVPVLQQLAQQEPEVFQKPVDSALLAIGVPEAVPGLLEDLKQSRNHTSYLRGKLQDLAGLRRKGISAGPEIIAYLDHPDWDIRMAAVQAIGFIGFREATPSLVRFLANEEDWLLTWVSIESLVRLLAQEAQNSVRKVADQHWFPPVRKKASEAVIYLQNRHSYDVPPLQAHFSPAQRFISEYYSYLFTAAWKPHTPGPENSADAEIDVPDGTLVGRDIGEFGGELTFIAKDGTKRIVLANNTQAITRFGTGIFAMSGLAHMDWNEGSIYRVTRDASGQWIAIRWRRLPGAPNWAVLRNTGSEQTLRISCVGGDVDISPDGTMRFIGQVRIRGGF